MKIIYRCLTYKKILAFIFFLSYCLNLYSSTVYSNSYLSLSKAIMVCQDIIKNKQLGIAADRFLKQRGFLEADTYYFERLIGKQIPKGVKIDSSNDNAKNSISFRQRMAPDKILSIIQAEFSYEDDQYKDIFDGYWFCYRNLIALPSSLPSLKKNGKPSDWSACLQIAGVDKYFQGVILLYPERSLSKNEFDAVFHEIQNISSKLFTHRISQNIQSLDAIIGQDESNEIRISLYYTKSEKNNYQIVIVFNANAAPDSIKLIPYKN